MDDLLLFPCVMGDYVCALQHNGEHIHLEKWIYNRWMWHSLDDPDLTYFLAEAKRIRIGW